MWHLIMAEKGEAWATVGRFQTVSAAAQKIIELEDYPVPGIFFVILIETGPAAASEQDAFGHLEHTGRSGRCYVVQRTRH